MGIQISGMFGGFYKRTGALIGIRGKGKDIVTALHHPNTKAATEKQIVQQEKFAMLTGFFVPIGNLVAKGFKQYAKKNTPLNAACKFNWGHAFVETDGNVALNYPLLVYSRGNIATPNCPSVSSAPLLPGQLAITFSWLSDSQSRYNQNTDMATFVIFNTSNKRFTTAIKAANRAARSYTMTVDEVTMDSKLYCYMNFENNCSVLTGNSVCVDNVVL